MLTGLLDGLFSGISIGAVLLIAALGLAIVFGLMGVINMAHGELMMLGAYTTFVVQNAFKLLGSPWAESYILFALPLAFIVAAIAGIILERGVIRYLYGRPLETLLATWGVSLILQQFVRSVNWVLLIGIALFCLLFFGAMSILARRADFERIRGWVIAVMLPLSLGVAALASSIISNTYKLAVTKPWFGAQNVNVTAPEWLRGNLPIFGIQLPYIRLF
ncbi:MAG: branched-chain amino acid ABC transporter permease, partial [Coleofasciculaceae cyanobacterium]